MEIVGCKGGIWSVVRVEYGWGWSTVGLRVL